MTGSYDDLYARIQHKIDISKATDEELKQFLAQGNRSSPNSYGNNVLVAELRAIDERKRPLRSEASPENIEKANRRERTVLRLEPIEYHYKRGRKTEVRQGYRWTDEEKKFLKNAHKQKLQPAKAFDLYQKEFKSSRTKESFKSKYKSS